MILITGATGKTGLTVIKAAASKGLEIRALVHSVENSSLVLQAGTSESVVGNLLDATSLLKAASRVETIYLICPNVHPLESEMVRNLIEAAKASHIRRIVYHSVLFPQIEAMPHHWQKMRAEEMLIQSGLQFAILQPASYMQNVLSYWDAIKQGEYRVPYSVDSIFSPVDLEDVAEVVCRVLNGKDHEGTIYQLAGPERLSSRQMAEKMSVAFGKKVVAKAQPLGEWVLEANTRGADGYAIAALSKMFAYYDHHGLSASSQLLEKLLGRPAMTFLEFLNRQPR